jgi:hypothetical protein
LLAGLVLVATIAACSSDSTSSEVDFTPYFLVAVDDEAHLESVSDELARIDGVLDTEVVPVLHDGTFGYDPNDAGKAVEVRVATTVSALALKDTIREASNVRVVVGPRPFSIETYSAWRLYIDVQCAQGSAASEVYFNLDATSAQIRRVLSALEADPDVTNVKYIDIHEAFVAAQRIFEDEPDAISGMHAGDFPASAKFDWQRGSATTPAQKYEPMNGVKTVLTKPGCEELGSWNELFGL